MPVDTPVAPALVSVMSTPEPVVKPPESVIYPTTLDGEPPVTPIVPPVVPPATPPAVPPPVAPTDPTSPAPPVTPPGQPPAAPAATDYDLKLPEGSLLSAERQATLVKEAKEAGLSKDEAQEVLNSHEAVAKDVATRTIESVRAQMKVEQDKAMVDAKVLWDKQVREDPELGGANLPETALLSSRALNALTTLEERETIKQTGMDFHPIFVRMMTKVGKLIGEDPRLILGRRGEPPEDTSTPEAKAKKLFGKTTPGADGKLSA